MTFEKEMEIMVKFETLKNLLINLVNTTTIDMKDVHSTDQVKALVGAEKWLKENI